MNRDDQSTDSGNAHAGKHEICSNNAPSLEKMTCCVVATADSSGTQNS